MMVDLRMRTCGRSFKPKVFSRRTLRQDLHPGVSNAAGAVSLRHNDNKEADGDSQKRLLELRTPLSINGDGRPVVRPMFKVPVAEVDHLFARAHAYSQHSTSDDDTEGDRNEDVQARW